MLDLRIPPIGQIDKQKNLWNHMAGIATICWKMTILEMYQCLSCGPSPHMEIWHGGQQCFHHLGFVWK
jgi:hypothetical protein